MGTRLMACAFNVHKSHSPTHTGISCSAFKRQHSTAAESSLPPQRNYGNTLV